MIDFTSPRLILAATIVTAGCLLAITPAQPAHAQDFSRPAQTPGTNVDSSDYGAGGHMNATVNQATGELTGQVFDPQNTLRREVKETYSIDGGSKHEAERQVYDFGLKGDLLFKTDYKFDLKGGLSYLDNEHFGMHGERTWEQKTTYKLDGFDTSTWHAGLDYDHTWATETTTYKPASTTPGQPAKPATPNAQPLQAPPPSSMQVGVLFPRDFHAGETVTGSLWPASYAEGFKTVPGLSEYTFPIEVAHLPDGTPSWSGLEIGVKDDGYSSVNPNGTFSLHIPSTWTGPLQLQTRDLYSLPGAGPSNALLNIGNPVAAPALPTNLISPKVTGVTKAENLAYLKHLWNLAYNLEEDFNAAEDIKDDDYYWAQMGDLEEYEYYLWEEIDSVIDTLPPADVAQLASDQIKKADEGIKTLEDGPQTPDNVAELKDLQGWTDFLDDEAGNAHWLAGDRFWIKESPYWTNPILTQGKLGAIRGDFYDNPLDTNLHIGTNTIWPLAGTGSELYFMPPINLTPGLTNLILDGPGMPPTEMPVFYMTLTMWADQLNLHKGQSTTYYVKLDGLNGLPSSAWSSSFNPTDLISPSELSGSSGASSTPGSSQSGYITLAVTNESPGTITMKNTFSTLDAKLFVPSGSYQISGGVGAIADGGFSILGVARAFLQPELGFGYPQGSTPPASSGFGDSLWNPSTHLDYMPGSTTGLYSLASCPSSLGDTPCTGGALPPNTATIGDTAPVQGESPITPEHAAAIKAVSDALEKANSAKSKQRAKEIALGKVWDAVMKAVPKPIWDAYRNASWDRLAARLKLAKAAEAMGAQPTPDNTRTFGEAAGENAVAENAFGQAEDALKSKLNTDLSDRLNWARGEFKIANEAADQARADWEAAQHILDGFPPLPPSPPPPPPPPPPA
ncbi:MAG: hypothetical protein ABSA42_02690 [Terracidiphilus sp.]|jgi:hypothetical protein